MTRASLALFVALVASTVSCRKPAPSGAGTPASSAAPTSTGAPLPSASGHVIIGPGDTVRGTSIYALDAQLTAQDGTKITLGTYRGKWVLLSMFYSSCPYACPTLISNIKRIEAALDPETRAETRVLLISFDPANDSPEVLRRTAATHKADLTRWTFATAPEDTVREVAAVLGIKYRQADGSFNHSSLITLLDREGKIDLRVDGMSDSTADVKKRLGELAR